MHPAAPLLLFLGLLVTAGCSASTPLTADEAALARDARVEVAIAQRARDMGTGLARWQGQTADFDTITAAGLVLLTERKQGEAVTLQLRKALAGTAYHAYLREENFGYEPDEVVVTALDDAGYLAMTRPDAINYGMDHDAVMHRLAPWRQRYGLQLFGAGGDWIRFDITRPPADWLAFAREVYAFCPDVVDQGTGDVETLAREMEAARMLYLWWD